jgi:hypothetical protein
MIIGHLESLRAPAFLAGAVAVTEMPVAWYSLYEGVIWAESLTFELLPLCYNFVTGGFSD